jgi:sarcosine oxidase subunit alpha
MDRRIYDGTHRRYVRGARVQIDFEGKQYPAFENEPLAVALFASGVQVLSRSSKYHRPRAFFCLSGSCGSCLMRVDGLPNTKSCRSRAHAGCSCRRQNAFPSARFDVFAAADWIFPHGMDHHTLATSSRLMNEVMKKIVRQLGGLGQLPEAPPADMPPQQRRHVEIAVIGAGPAGMAAAAAAAEGGAQVLCVDEGDVPGGSLHSHPDFGYDDALKRAAELREAGVEILSNAAVVGYFQPDSRRPDPTLAVVTQSGLVELTADRTIYATGSHDQNALFEDNDLPGVLSARAVGLLAVRYGIRPAERAVILGGGPYARALAHELLSIGVEARVVDGIGERPVAARGSSWIEALDVVDLKGKVKRVKCDLCAVAALPAPASELPRQHGARVVLDERCGGFAVVSDRHGRTTATHAYSCGDCTGFVGPARAAAHGHVAGLSAALDLRESPALRRRRDQASEALGVTP